MNSLEKEFCNSFEKEVERTIKRFKLFNKKEPLVVAISGGKDSMTILYLLKKLGYNIKALTIDLLIGEWSKENLDNTKAFCLELGVPLKVVSIRESCGGSICYIRAKVKEKKDLKNCTICGTIRRSLLNKEARPLGGVLVTGHNLDDEAQTILMNLLKNNLGMMSSWGAKSKWLDKKFLPRAKPLFLSLEDDIRKYSKLMKFPVVYDNCPCSTESFRRRLKETVNRLLSGEEKLQIVELGLKLFPGMFTLDKTEMKYCNECGEIARREICKSCEILGLIKS